jgi:hypothetical protein
MSVGKALEIAAVMLMPTAAVAGVLYGSRAVVRLQRLRLDRRARLHPLSSRAPIEVSAARLRQMLQRREELLRSTDSALRTHLVALEHAIFDTASDLADALGVERPARQAAGSLHEGELAKLINRLAEAGIVLPPTSLRS